jgi:hypothetical protein
MVVEIRRGFWKTPALESRQNKIASGTPSQTTFSDKNRMRQSAPVRVCAGCVGGSQQTAVLTVIVS